MFVGYGPYFNIRYVKTIHNDRKNNSVILSYEDGSIRSFHGCIDDEIEFISAQTIPAYPGFYRVDFWKEPGRGLPNIETMLGEISKTPVIGWKLVSHGSQYPVCPDGYGYAHLGDNWESGVLWPGGQVDNYDGIYESTSKWLEDIRYRWPSPDPHPS